MASQTGRRNRAGWRKAEFVGNGIPVAFLAAVFATASSAAISAEPSAAAPVAGARQESRFEGEIVRYEQADRDRPPAPGGVLFLGSSNIRLWTTLADDFAGFGPVNRGLGGCRLDELVPATRRLVAAARPAVVVVSAGTNDIAAGAAPDEVGKAFIALVAALRGDVPGVKIAFLSIAPSISRWDQRERQLAANEAVRGFIAAQGDGSGLVFIDTDAAFLGSDGRPAAECFVEDKQHPSPLANARRAAIIRPVLETLLPENR